MGKGVVEVSGDSSVVEITPLRKQQRVAGLCCTQLNPVVHAIVLHIHRVEWEYPHNPATASLS